MAKATTHISKGKTEAERKVDIACENCKFVIEHKNGLACGVPLPPHLSTNGRVPYVHTRYACGLFTPKG